MLAAGGAVMVGRFWTGLRSHLIHLRAGLNKELMHLDFAFTAVQTLWTLTFAAHLVLLVVLLGRELTGRFRWFTTGIVLVALRLLASRLLFGRLPQLTMSAMFIILADISAVVALLVIFEVAGRAFARVQRRARITWSLAVLLVAGLVLTFWGPWPAWKSIAPDSLLSALGLMQLIAQKAALLVDVLSIALGLLVLVFGRRYGAGWRSHAQLIVIGLSTASIGQLSIQAVWQFIAKTAIPHSMADYERIVGLREKLFNANSAIYLVVLIWWIVCLWFDEPGRTASPDGAKVAAALPEGETSAELHAQVPKDATE